MNSRGFSPLDLVITNYMFGWKTPLETEERELRRCRFQFALTLSGQSSLSSPLTLLIHSEWRCVQSTGTQV
jgi:hypothetical protein